MKIQLVALFLALTWMLSPQESHSAIGAFDVPVLRAHSYANLRYPTQLTKPIVQWMLQRSADELYGRAFVDIGNMTDFMHMHVLLKPVDLNEKLPVDKSIVDIELRPDWSRFDVLGALIHTQEYGNRRNGAPYLGPNGELEYSHRNQVLWLKDSDRALRGTIEDARSLIVEEAKANIGGTIRTSMLLPEYFGPNAGKWEFSIYFFRVRCDQPGVAGALANSDSNIVAVQIRQTKVCLALMSFHCRNHSEDSKYCSGGPKLLPDESLNSIR